ncbi:MAG TPA: PP2C family serine/threonine-protein phosphatase [Pyrinomonadaceae bacterium]|nr:PP2C family serine/threonine-protein phosphatase [Pyrinomonadaceae bacterium]
MSDPHRSQWQVVGHSVRGASHERSGLPNQDAIRWLPESGAGPSLVLAVADGHGSAKYSRSHVGASLAVETTAQLMYEFVAGQTGADNLSLTKRAAEEWLPGALVRAWLAAVAEHASVHPLSDVELDALGGNRSDLASSINEKLSIAYGTTILATAVTESFVLYLQLGDGEILTVTTRGEVSRPLCKDDRLFANETTSLCAPEAWRDFRVSFQHRPQMEPALILLSTDGYPNSFRDEAGFLKVGSDILTIIETEGLQKVGQDLEGWLKDSTNAGSGDDVTLGILWSSQEFQVDRMTIHETIRVNAKGS